MKNPLKVFTVLIFALALVSCESEQVDQSQESIDNRALLLGTWGLIESSTNGTVDDNSQNCKLFNTIEFLTTNAFVNVAVGTNCAGVESTYEDYSVNKSVLRVGSTTVDIVTLTATTLVVDYRTTNAYRETYIKR